MEGTGTGASVFVIVVGFMVVDVAVMVVVTWMKEVSNTDTVFSSVSVMRTDISLVMKTVTASPPLGTRGTRVMIWVANPAMVGRVVEWLEVFYLSKRLNGA